MAIFSFLNTNLYYLKLNPNRNHSLPYIKENILYQNIQIKSLGHQKCAITYYHHFAQLHINEPSHSKNYPREYNPRLYQKLGKNTIKMYAHGLACAYDGVPYFREELSIASIFFSFVLYLTTKHVNQYTYNGFFTYMHKLNRPFSIINPQIPYATVKLQRFFLTRLTFCPLQINTKRPRHCGH